MKYFQNNLRRKRAVLMLLLVACCLLFPVSALASFEIPEVAVSVSARVSGDAPSPPESFTFRLTDVTSGEYRELTLSGPGTGSFPPALYSSAGVYRYTLSQLPGDRPGASYDTKVYDVTVTVTNAEDGDGLRATVVLTHNGKKQEDAEFRTDYTDPNILDGPGDSEIDADIPPAPPSETPEIGPADEPPVVSRPALPHSDTLIQTGQFKWPIPLLGGLGLTFTAVGLLIGKKEKDEK